MLKLAGELLEGQPDALTRDIFETVKTGHYVGTPLACRHPYASTLTLTANRLYAFAYPIVRARTPDKLYVAVQTAAAGKKIRIGLYNDNGSFYPGACLSNGGEVPTDSTGVKTVDYTTQLTKSLIWIVFISDGAPKVYREAYYLNIMGSESYGHQARAGYYKDDTYGNLPDPFPAGATLESNVYGAGFRFTSND